MRSSEVVRVRVTRWVVAPVGLVVLTLVVLAGCSNPDDHAGIPDVRLVSYRTPTMGTWGTITIATADSAITQASALRAKDGWDHVNELMSNWSQTSEISRVNREAGSDTVAVDPELALVLGEALSVAEASNGAFDVTVEPLVRIWGFLGGEPRVPDAESIASTLSRIGWHKVYFDVGNARVFYREPTLRVDLGGIAKGYGVDLATKHLRSAGETSAMINLSGNIRTIGTPPGREEWSVGIRDPRDRVSFLGTLRIAEAALATSGQYEQFVSVDGKRYGHILDPRTGWPVEGVLSVTVLAPTAMMADAWSTAFFVMGVEEAKAVASSSDDLQLIIIESGDMESDGMESRERSGSRIVDTVWVEASLAESFRLIDEADFAQIRLF